MSAVNIPFIENLIRLLAWNLARFDRSFVVSVPRDKVSTTLPRTIREAALCPFVKMSLIGWAAACDPRLAETPLQGVQAGSLDPDQGNLIPLYLEWAITDEIYSLMGLDGRQGDPYSRTSIC